MGDNVEVGNNPLFKVTPDKFIDNTTIPPIFLLLFLL